MTPRERLLTAWRGGQPDRVPIVGRMNKFLRHHWARVDPGEWRDRAAGKFGLDTHALYRGLPLPISSPRVSGRGGPDYHRAGA